TTLFRSERGAANRRATAPQGSLALARVVANQLKCLSKREDTMRLVQLKSGNVRRVAVVEEPKLRLLRDFDSVYGLAEAAIAHSGKLPSVAADHLTDESLDYDPIYSGSTQW